MTAWVLGGKALKRLFFVFSLYYSSFRDENYYT